MGRICEVIFALVMIFIGLFPFGPIVQEWALVVLGLGLLVHAFTCKMCNCALHEEKKSRTSRPSKRRR